MGEENARDRPGEAERREPDDPQPTPAGMEAGLKEGGRSSRFARIYNGFSEVCMEHKWASLAVCLIGLGAGVSLLPLLGTNLFPKDLHSAFTVNLYLPALPDVASDLHEVLRLMNGADG